MSLTPRRQRHPAPVARFRAGTEGAPPPQPGHLRRGVITTGRHLIPVANWLLARIPIPDWAWRYFVTCPFCDTVRRNRTDPCPECKL